MSTHMACFRLRIVVSAKCACVCVCVCVCITRGVPESCGLIFIIKCNIWNICRLLKVAALVKSVGPSVWHMFMNLEFSSLCCPFRIQTDCTMENVRLFMDYFIHNWNYIVQMSPLFSSICFWGCVSPCFKNYIVKLSWMIECVSCSRLEKSPLPQTKATNIKRERCIFFCTVSSLFQQFEREGWNF